MSREIDITKELSDEDRQYLVDRAEYSKLELNRQYVEDGEPGDASALSASDGTRSEGAFDPEREPSGTGFTGRGIDLDSNRTVDLPPHLQRAEDGDPPVPSGVEGSDDGGDGEPNPDADSNDAGNGVSDWYEADTTTVEALKAELGSRELSKSGNKAELIARLREDDASRNS